MGFLQQTRNVSGKTQIPNRRNHWSAEWSSPKEGPHIPPKALTFSPVVPTAVKRGTGKLRKHFEMLEWDKILNVYSNNDFTDWEGKTQKMDFSSSETFQLFELS